MTARAAIKPIKTEKDYARALARVDTLMAAEADTPEGDALDVLVTLIEAYETRRWRIDLPDPIEAIYARMEQRHLRPKDLEPFLGSSGRVVGGVESPASAHPSDDQAAGAGLGDSGPGAGAGVEAAIPTVQAEESVTVVGLPVTRSR